MHLSALAPEGTPMKEKRRLYSRWYYHNKLKGTDNYAKVTRNSVAKVLKVYQELREEVFTLLGAKCTLCKTETRKYLLIHYTGESRYRSGAAGLYREILVSPEAQAKTIITCRNCLVDLLEKEEGEKDLLPEKPLSIEI